MSDFDGWNGERFLPLQSKGKRKSKPASFGMRDLVRTLPDVSGMDRDGLGWLKILRAAPRVPWVYVTDTSTGIDPDLGIKFKF